MKIRDAREKLHQISKVTDARVKLLKKRNVPSANQSASIDNSAMRRNTRRPSSNPPPRPRSNSRFPLELSTKSMIDMMDIDMPLSPSFPIRRTVTNDRALPMHSDMPPFPSFGLGGGRGKSPPFFNSGASSDPFDCYEVPVRRPIDVSEPVHIQRKIFNIDSHHEVPRKGILRTPHHIISSSNRRFIPDENSSLSYEMRSRLERAPDPNESSGIFSRSQPPSSPPLSQSNGYRIVVSNLHSSVSQGDIKELFEDIGELMEARLVRPGVAEVIFRTLRDAEEAVDTYHNRHLDGQPMKCLLVNPRSSSNPTAPAIKPVSQLRNPTSSKTPLEIDIDALHTVLFRRK